MTDRTDIATYDAADSDPIPDPGLPEHQHRPTDTDPSMEKRAERQVAGLFTAAILLSLGFCVVYFAIPPDAVFLGFNGLNIALGLTLAGALLFIGIGAIQWAKKLMSDVEIVEERHPAGSSPEDARDALAAVAQGAADSGFGRRKLIRNTFLGAVAVLGLPAIVGLRDLGPLPNGAPSRTVWRQGMRVVMDVTGTPIKLSDVDFGTLINAQPEIIVSNPDFEPPGWETLEGTAKLNAKASASVILVRINPDDITPYPGRRNWNIDGVLCYSKICTHVGCPISLYEQTTHHLLCPCHQSTFDLANNGIVVFGPAARSLPQLPLAVDSEGYLIAQSDFQEPVGPSFWERGGEEDRSA